MAWAGCVGDAPASFSEEAPEGPGSLRVGAYSDGMYLARQSSSAGHRIHYEADFGGGGPPVVRQSIQPDEDRRAIELWLAGGVPERDRFLRPVEAVASTYRTTFLTPREGMPPMAESRAVWDQGTEQLIYVESTSVMRFGSTSCFLTQCERSEEVWTFDHRIYDRAAAWSAGWGDLAGHVLRLGQTISFNRTVSWGGVEDATYYLNYTVLRQDWIGGVRTFVVEPSATLVLPPAGDEEAEEEEVPVEREVDDLPPLSERVHLLWFSHGAPVPVKEVLDVPFRFGRQEYWWNSTVDLVVHEPGPAPLRWGQGPRHEAVTQRPGMETVPLHQWLDTAVFGLSYEPSDAWRNVRADATLTELHEFLERHPDAWPATMHYFPDASRGAYTWTFHVGVPGGDLRDQVTVQSRFQAPWSVQAPPSVGVVQNRVSHDFSPHVPPAAERVADLRVATAADLSQALGRDRWAGDPFVTANFGAYWFDAAMDRWNPAVMLHGTRQLIATGPPVLHASYWLLSDSLEMDPRDGGLHGMNTTFDLLFHEWPWLPAFGPWGSAAMTPDGGAPSVGAVGKPVEVAPGVWAVPVR